MCGFGVLIEPKRQGSGVVDYNRLLEEQGGGCAICGRSGIQLVADWDRETDVISGVLCGNCVVGLERFGNDSERLRCAANYLRGIHQIPEVP